MQSREELDESPPYRESVWEKMCVVRESDEGKTTDASSILQLRDRFGSGTG